MVLVAVVMNLWHWERFFGNVLYEEIYVAGYGSDIEAIVRHLGGFNLNLNFFVGI